MLERWVGGVGAEGTIERLSAEIPARQAKWNATTDFNNPVIPNRTLESKAARKLLRMKSRLDMEIIFQLVRLKLRQS